MEAFIHIYIYILYIIETHTHIYIYNILLPPWLPGRIAEPFFETLRRGSSKIVRMMGILVSICRGNDFKYVYFSEEEQEGWEE